jgi:hypothetical protein
VPASGNDASIVQNHPRMRNFIQLVNFGSRPGAGKRDWDNYTVAGFCHYPVFFYASSTSTPLLHGRRFSRFTGRCAKANAGTNLRNHRDDGVTLFIVGSTAGGQPAQSHSSANALFPVAPSRFCNFTLSMVKPEGAWVLLDQ